MMRHMSHITRHTPHVTRHLSYCRSNVRFIKGTGSTLEVTKLLKVHTHPPPPSPCNRALWLRLRRGLMMFGV